MKKDTSKTILYSLLFGTITGLVASSTKFQFYGVLIAIVFIVALFFVKKIKLNYIYIFMLISCIDVSPIVVGGSYIRLYQFMALPVIFKMIYEVAFLKQSDSNNVDKYIYFWVASYFLAFQNIISMSDFKAVLIGQIFLILVYKATMHFCNKENIEEIENYFILGIIFIAIVGIIQIALSIIGIDIGISHADVIGIPRPSSLMREPDWYGFICMIGAIFMIVYRMKGKIVFSKTFDIISIAILCIGLFLSMTRTTWVVFVAILFIYFLFFTKRKEKLQITKLICIAAMVGTIGLAGLKIGSPSTFDNILKRINPKTTIQNDNGAFNTRLYSINIMLDYIKLHPFTGNGVGSMGTLSVDKVLLNEYGIMGQVNSGRGNANLYITNTFDTGIIGTVILIMFNLVYLFDMIRMYKKTRKCEFLAYFLVFLSFLFVFQMNNGIRFGFVWIFLGFSMKRYLIEDRQLRSK